MSWLSPSHGTLKVNFDAFVLLKKDAAANVIRNHNARVVRAGGKLLSSSSIPIAELNAAWLVSRWP